MKVYGNGNWRGLTASLAGLAVLLCLPWYGVTAVSKVPVIKTASGETMWKIPEGYRPLPVREFVVDAEKNDTYILSLGVQDEAIDQNNWILTKYIRGHLRVYNPVNKELLYSVSIPKEEKIPVVGFIFPYNKIMFQGYYYYLELKKGQYLIHPELFIMNSEVKEPDILLSFRRKKFVW
ncbi:hypothetical protein HX910_005107 [Salmonella enterica]|uniref:Uncharacterized protein n=1 Tax=Salmonella enterica subsp. salamae TaxID=59202 RepID=A0A5Y3XHP0_SALER|nr:hypothetical protein [Salmonella enterica subsp. salamae]EFP4587118.1 hypothetical protein [Salmonella enterica]EFP4637883.1 hypothetical protein [Salmonella enterica]EFS0366341.1 hypothetical protein [Salmonella enterica]EGK1508654.1 hypothetical protein [Salmonella enterica]